MKPRNRPTEALAGVQLPPRKLPFGWRMVKFGEMAESIGERVDDPSQAGVDRYVGLEHLDPESLKIARWGKPTDVEATKLRFYPGDIVFGKRRFYQRKLAVADFEGICSAHALVLRAKEDVVHKDFLPFFMLSDQFFDRAMMISVGGLSPTINWSTLAKQEFAIPPKPEQRRIAEILWAADAAVVCCLKLAEEGAKTDQAVFERWLQSGDKWPSVALDDACTIHQGQVDPTCEPYRSMIHIAPDDIEGQTGRILERRSAAEDAVSSGNYAFREDAILYSKIRPNLMKVVLTGFAGVCSADVYPVYPKPNILPEVLLRILLSRRFTEYAIARSVRSAIPKINRKALLSYRFQLSPLPQQRRYLETQASTAAPAAAAGHHASNTRTLIRAILGELLDGAPRKSTHVHRSE